MKGRHLWAALAALGLTAVSHAGVTYSTGFEEFSAGSANGQQGWAEYSNSNILGNVTSAQACSGMQSLELRTLPTDEGTYAGVIDGLRTHMVDAGGETGALGSTVMGNHMTFSYCYRTPDATTTTNSAWGGQVEIDPSFNTGGGGSRYGGVYVIDGAQDTTGSYSSSNKIVMEVDTPMQYGDLADNNWAYTPISGLDYSTWYRVNYDLMFVNGINGTAPNDVLTVSVSDMMGNTIGSVVGSTWEVGFKDGRWDGNPAYYSVDSLTFRANNHSDDKSLGFVDNLTITTTPEPATWAAMGLGALGLLRRRKKG